MQKRRRVATIPFGGDPQDEHVGEVRKKLYEAVTQDGLVPKLDEDGRPMFFLDDSKACFFRSWSWNGRLREQTQLCRIKRDRYRINTCHFLIY